MSVLYRSVPQPNLSAYIEAFYLYEGDPAPHARERRLPDGSMELVINLRDDRLRVYDRQHPDQFQSFHGCVLSGAHTLANHAIILTNDSIPHLCDGRIESD